MPPKHWLYTVPLRLRSLFHRDHVERELDEELEFHVARQVADAVARGEDAAEARRHALLALEGVQRCKEECRDARRLNLVGNLWQDTRYAWRALRRNPGFTAVAIFTLALGVGANSAIFSLINAALLHPLPYPEPDRLALLFERNVMRPGEGENVVSFANFSDWQKYTQSYESMALQRQNSFNLSDGMHAAPERVDGAICSSALFATLGVKPAMGRTFTAEEDRPGGTRVVVISYALWQGRFGGDAEILRKQIRVDGAQSAVIGVMPKGFTFPAPDTAIWAPVRQIADEQSLGGRGAHQFYVVGRVRKGVTMEQATADLDRVQRRIWTDHPGALVGRGGVTRPIDAITVSHSRTPLLVLLAAVGFVLLIACVNISNLLLARGAQRSREIALRAALGATRKRLLQQLLTESVLLSVMGALVGVLVGYVLTNGLDRYARALIRGDDVDTSAAVRMDGTVLLFTACVALAAGILAAWIPAGRATRADPSNELKEGGRSSTGGRRQERVRSILVALEVSISVVLLIGAGLLIRSFAELLRVDTGVRVSNVLTAGIALPEAGYATRSQVSNFQQRLVERLQALPGVRSAGLVSCLPVAGYCGDSAFFIQGRKLPPGEFYFALNRSASPGYFQAAGIPLVAGRAFTELDGRGFGKSAKEGAVIVSESAVRKFWPAGDALEQRISFGDGEGAARFRVIGIVKDVLIGLSDHPRPTLYLPLFDGDRNTFHAVVHTAGPPETAAAGVRDVLHGMDPDIPPFQMQTMEEVVRKSASRRSLTMFLLTSFAGLALLMAAIGLYGVLSYLAARRTAEIGIRMALGAGRGEIYRLVIQQGMVPTLIGLFIGLPAAAALTRAMRGLLFGVDTGDVSTFLSAPLVLLAVAFLACLVPAWRASRVDPLSALRAE